MNTWIWLLIDITVFSVFLALFILVQKLIGKYRPQSNFYWRKIPVVSFLFFYCARNSFISLFIYGLKGVAIINPSFKDWIKTARYIFIFNRLRLIFSELDDICDTSLPQVILAKGEASLGPNLCPFAVSLLSKKHIRIFEKIVQYQLFSQAELIAFGNLLALKLYQQATLTVEYEKAQTMESKALIREQIVQANIEVGGSCMAFAIHFIKKTAPLADLLIDTPNMTYAHLKKAYPSATKAGELLQMMHDISNFRVDLEEEKKIQKICPNYLLAQFEKYAVSSTSIQALHALPMRGVGFYELPQDVRDIILKNQRLFTEGLFKNNPMLNIVMNLSWEYIYRIGFIPYNPSLARPIKTTVRWVKSVFTS